MLKPVSFFLATLLCATSAFGTRIGDITRLGGQRTNVLTGMGLVVGLKGTGDGGKYARSIQSLGQMLSKMGAPGTLADLKDTKNVAIVAITVTLPENGVRDGEVLDVHVNSVGAATSLRGGRLYITPLFGPNHEPYIARIQGSDGRIYEEAMPFAMAQGGVVLEDPTIPTNGVIRRGATMEVDLPTEQIDRAGRITLVIEDPSASWAMANTIAKTINGDRDADGVAVAVAIDPKNVVVTIPPEERGTPDNFISRVLETTLDVMPSEARVVINERSGTMVLTGDVQISPVIVSHKGLTISTLLPPPTPRPEAPIVKTTEFAGLSTNKDNAAKLQDLLDALDQLKVPAEDKIAIVKTLYTSGKLHAKLIVE